MAIKKNKGESSVSIAGAVSSSDNGVWIISNSGTASLSVDEGIICSGTAIRDSSNDKKSTITVNGDVESGKVGIQISGNEGESTVSVDGNVTAGSSGISVSSNKESVDIIVDGDVTSNSNGINITNNTGTINIVIDGTLDAKNNSIRYMSRVTRKIGSNGFYEVDPAEEGDLNITVWQLKSDSDNLVKAYYFNKSYHAISTATATDTDDETTENESYEDETEDLYTELATEILQNINYIIRTDEVENGTITLSGTRLISGYNTAHESDEIIINVETASGYQLDAVKNGDSVLTKNADGTYTLIVPRGGGVEISAVLSAIQQTNSSSVSTDESVLTGSNGSSQNTSSTVVISSYANSVKNSVISSYSSSSSDSDDDSYDYSSTGSDNGSNVREQNSLSGASVKTTSSVENGIKNTTAEITIGGKTASVASTVTVAEGKITTLRYVGGDIAGATFDGVGTVSADGTTVTNENGETFALTTAPVCVISTEDGQSVGYFVDPETNAPIATGKTEVYYQLGEDGQLHAHWVDPNGYFYTGTVELNGQIFTFDNEGVMISVG